MANPNPKPPKRRGRKFCTNNERGGRRNDRKTSKTFRIYRDEVEAIDQHPAAAAAVAAAAAPVADAPTVPSKRKLTKADLTNRLAYAERGAKRVRRDNARLVADGKKKSEQIEKGKQLVKKKAAQLKDGLKAKDARCQQKIESIRTQNQQMLDAKDEQCTNQLKRVEKKCAKKLEKKEEQCEMKISSLKKRHAEEVDNLERRVKRLKSTLEQRNISIDALKEKVVLWSVAYETRSESIENELMAQLTEEGALHRGCTVADACSR